MMAYAGLLERLSDAGRDKVARHIDTIAPPAAAPWTATATPGDTDGAYALAYIDEATRHAHFVYTPVDTAEGRAQIITTLTGHALPHGEEAARAVAQALADQLADTDVAAHLAAADACPHDTLWCRNGAHDPFLSCGTPEHTLNTTDDRGPVHVLTAFATARDDDGRDPAVYLYDGHDDAEFSNPDDVERLASDLEDFAAHVRALGALLRKARQDRA